MNVEIQQVSLSLGGRTILQDINCQFTDKQISVVVGANGVGKTTLLRAMAALYPPAIGKITLDGRLLSLHEIELRRRLHLLESTPEFVGLTAVDHICQAALYYHRDPMPLKPQIMEWLRKFQLLDCALEPLEILSRGQQYKVAFIALLAMRPDLWLLDEPFAAGVDPQGMAIMRDEIARFVGDGGTVVYSTQVVEIAQQFSDRVLVLANGRLQADLSGPQLRNSQCDRALEQILLDPQVNG